jgi:plasmid stabilization system protein ParE
MVKGHKTIIWDKNALNNFESSINYISKDSVKNAEKVKQELLLKIEDLKNHPEKYSPDKYKYNNDGSYRAFEKHHFRVVYRIFQTSIKIITFRHTSMEPKFY